NWQTEKQTENGYATKRNAYFDDIWFAQSLADEKTKNAVHQIEQAPQLFRRGITRPQKIEKGCCRSCVREDEGRQSDDAAPDHPTQALVVLEGEFVSAREQDQEAAYRDDESARHAGPRHDLRRITQEVRVAQRQQNYEQDRNEG